MTSPLRGAFPKYYLSFALPALQCHVTTVSTTKPSFEDIFLKSMMTSTIEDVLFSQDYFATGALSFITYLQEIWPQYPCWFIWTLCSSKGWSVTFFSLSKAAIFYALVDRFQH